MNSLISNNDEVSKEPAILMADRGVCCLRDVCSDYTAHYHIQQHHQLDKAARKHLKTQALRGTDIVPGVVSLCAMNLYLHGIGSTADANDPPVDRADALAQPSGRKFDMILANPPFGKKGGYTIVGDDGKISTEKQEYERDEFWATTANKQLNFLQHIVSELNVGGTAAVVLPDNVLFEGGAGETIRRELLKRCNVHTLLRLPTDIFYSKCRQKGRSTA